MPITVHCQACAAAFAVKESFAGKLIRCPKCEANIVVGSQASAKPPAKRPAPPPVDPVAAAERKLKLRAILGFIGACVIQFIGGLIFQYGAANVALLLAPGPGYLMMFIGAVFIALGYLVYIWSCYSYADADGYPRIYGLFGFLTICGLPLVWLIVRIGGKRPKPKTADDDDDDDEE